MKRNKFFWIMFLIPSFFFSWSRGQSFQDISDATFLRMALIGPSVLSLSLDEAQVPSKKPFWGAVFSAAIPGTGQMWGGSWLKGVLFLGLETALWVSYDSYSDKGKEWEDRFIKFADTHWDENRWRTQYNENEEPKTHDLPSEKTQQYYEMIGKYDEFKWGWDDYVSGGPELTEHREYYENLRHKSNTELKKASTCAMIVMANHVISSLDAAWTIHRKNLKLKAFLQPQYKYQAYSFIPMASIQLMW